MSGGFLPQHFYNCTKQNWLEANKYIILRSTFCTMQIGYKTLLVHIYTLTNIYVRYNVMSNTQRYFACDISHASVAGIVQHLHNYHNSNTMPSSKRLHNGCVGTGCS